MPPAAPVLAPGLFVRACRVGHAISTSVVDDLRQSPAFSLVDGSKRAQRLADCRSISRLMSLSEMGLWPYTDQARAATINATPITG